MRSKLVALSLCLLVTTGYALALDEGFGKLYPTKDVYHCGSCVGDGVNAAGWANAGAAKYSFIKAGVWAYQSDYDRTALDAAMDAYSDFIVTYSVYWPAGDQQGSESVLYPYTWTTTTSNWAEGDGDIPALAPNGGWRDGAGFSLYPFNWTKGTAAYTMFGSQTYYTDTDGAPATGDEIVDPVNSVGWTCADGTAAMHPDAVAPCATGAPPDPTGWADSKAECVIGAFNACGGGSAMNNTVGFEPEIHDDPATTEVIEAVWGSDIWKSVVIDAAITDDLRGDGRSDVAGLGVWGTFADWTNHWMSTREDFSTTPGAEYDNRPYLRLLVPGDATLNGYVDGGDYTQWADNYHVSDTGKDWETGDFTGDGMTEGADYTLWADHYGDDARGLVAVPEPFTLALLGVGAVALIRRRR